MENLLELIPNEFINEFMLSSKKPAELQIFKTDIGISGEKMALERHINEIIKAIVYSKECRVRSSNGELYCMQGFLERTGRLPTREDKIHIIKGTYFMTLFGRNTQREIANVSDQRYFISEVNFYVTSK